MGAGLRDLSSPEWADAVLEQRNPQDSQEHFDQESDFPIVVLGEYFEWVQGIHSWLPWTRCQQKTDRQLVTTAHLDINDEPTEKQKEGHVALTFVDPSWEHHLELNIMNDFVNTLVIHFQSSITNESDYCLN